MSNPGSAESDAGPVEETYTPGQDRSLDTAILKTIAAYEDTDCTDLEFVLRDDVDTGTLGGVFHGGTAGDAFVEVTMGDVHVELWTVDGSETVEIRVTGRQRGWR